jgi:hypothetical protein
LELLGEAEVVAEDDAEAVDVQVVFSLEYLAA